MGNELSSNRRDVQDPRDRLNTSRTPETSNFLRYLRRIESSFSNTMSLGDRNVRELAKKYQEHQSKVQELTRSIQLADTTREDVKQELTLCMKEIPEITKITAYRDFMKCFSEHGKRNNLAKTYIDRGDADLVKLLQRLQELNDKNKEFIDKSNEFKIEKLIYTIKENTLVKIADYYKTCQEKMLQFENSQAFKAFDECFKKTFESLGEVEQHKKEGNIIAHFEQDIQKLTNSNKNLKELFRAFQEHIFNETLSSFSGNYKQFEHFQQLQKESANYQVEFRASSTFNASREFLAWQKAWQKIFQDCDTTIQNLSHYDNPVTEAHKSLHEQFNHIKADNDSASYHAKLERTDELLASIPTAEKRENFKGTLDHLKTQYKLHKVSFELKNINESLEKYRRYSGSNHFKLQNLSYSQLQSLKRLFEKIITKAAGNDDYFRSLFISHHNDLDTIQKTIEQVSHHLDQNDSKKLNMSFEEAKNQLYSFETFLNKSDIAIANLRELSQEITKQKDRYPNISTRTMETFFQDTQRKSAERENRGMNKEAIKLILNSLYKHAPPKQALKDGHQEFHMQSWPRSLGGSESLKKKPPYRSYANPEEGRLDMYYVYRNKDQRFKESNALKMQDIKILQKKLKVERLPDGFSKALSASDLGSDHYQLALQKYKELRGSDAPYQPLKVVRFDNIDNPETLAVLSRYVKTYGDKKTFTEEEDETFEAFNEILRTPLGRITPFMLVQNPEKVGYGEIKDISHIDVERNSAGTFHMEVHVAD